MAALLYKDFFIIATGLFDKNRAAWMPIADVSWQAATGRDFHTIEFSLECFPPRDQAEIFAIEAAEA